MKNLFKFVIAILTTIGLFCSPLAGSELVCIISLFVFVCVMMWLNLEEKEA